MASVCGAAAGGEARWRRRRPGRRPSAAARASAVGRGAWLRRKWRRQKLLANLGDQLLGRLAGVRFDFVIWQAD